MHKIRKYSFLKWWDVGMNKNVLICKAESKIIYTCCKIGNRYTTWKKTLIASIADIWPFIN